MDMTRPSSDGTTTASDELASKFLDALVSVLVDYRPTYVALVFAWCSMAMLTPETSRS
jgi:hypothetical protein